MCIHTCSMMTRDQQQEEQLKSPNLHIETSNSVKLSILMFPHVYNVYHFQPFLAPVWEKKHLFNPV